MKDFAHMTHETNTAAATDEARPALVPRLRFPEFRGAQGWEEVSLGSIANLRNGYAFKSSEYVDDGPYQIITIANVQQGNLTIESTKRITRLPSDIQQHQVLSLGDILISMTGNVGRVCRVTSEGLLLNQRVGKLMPEKVKEAFFYQALQREDFRNNMQLKAAGGAQGNLSSGGITDYAVNIPTAPAEQQKIADCLSSVDELIAAQARKVEALKTHKKGLMQQLFPREGETQPHLRFSEFRDAGEWVESPLSNFILSLDAGVSVNAGDRPANGIEFGVLKTSAVTNGVFEPEENKVVFSEVEQYRLKEPVSGDTIIISRMNTPALVGANAYIESSHKNLFLPDRLWAAKPRGGTSMRFLAFILGSEKGRAALSKLAKGSSGSMKNITKPEVLAFAVVAPSPAEQQRIADCLGSLDALITAATQELETLKTHKKGLMQQLFPQTSNEATA